MLKLTLRPYDVVHVGDLISIEIIGHSDGVASFQVSFRGNVDDYTLFRRETISLGTNCIVEVLRASDESATLGFNVPRHINIEADFKKDRVHNA